MGKAVRHPPRIFRVNWFRKDARGKFIWPGFGENMRVLEWIVGRCHGIAHGVNTTLGIIPRHEDLNWSGLQTFLPEQYEEISRVDAAAWREEVVAHDQLLEQLGTRLSPALALCRSQLHGKLAA
jgi:phosphoenolpyruvate carboxykinase (GTP)